MPHNPQKYTLLALVLLLFFLASCAAPPPITLPEKREPLPPRAPGTQRPYVIMGKAYYPLPTSEGYEEKGIASWYGPKFHGRKTANGETYDMHAETAAHKTLPMNTYLLVTNLENGKETVVRVNDRGPFVKGRIVDLSLTSAKAIDMVGKGTAQVRITALGETVSTLQNKTRVERFLPHTDFETGDFFVQIGSFTNKDNAERLQNKMLSWGKESIVQKFDRGDQLYYRVRIQAGNRLTAAKRVAKVLEEAGFPGFVVAR